MNRRHLLMAGVAGGAAASGLAWQSWRERQAQAELGDFWSRRFPQLDGRELALASLRGKPLVINFCATWCPPCIKEMPEIDRFHKAFASRGWQVLGLAVDRAEPVRAFLAQHPMSFGIALAGLEGTDLSRQLGNERGLLPFTAAFDAKGRVSHRKLGQTSYDELAAWAGGA